MNEYRKSSFCATGACVQVFRLAGGEVAVRNTTSTTVPQVFTQEEWEAFVLGVKNSEFDYETLVS